MQMGSKSKLLGATLDYLSKKVAKNKNRAKSKLLPLFLDEKLIANSTIPIRTFVSISISI